MKSPCLLRFGPFELDPDEGWFRRVDGAPLAEADAGARVHGGVVGEIPLQPMVFQALLLFVENSGRLMSKDELLATLWPDVEVEEGSLSQVIHKLRRALGDDGDGRRMLQTVPKRGFRFVAPVERVARWGPVAVERAAEVPKTEPQREVSEGLPGPGPILEEGAQQAPETTTAPPVSVGTPTFDAPVAVAEVAYVPPPVAPAARRPRPMRKWWALGALLGVGGVVAVLAAHQGNGPAAPVAAEKAASEPPPTTTETLATAPTSPPAGTATTPPAAALAAFPLLEGGPHPVERLTRLPERAQDASLAPDSTWFAFVSTRGGDGGYSIWAQRLDGGDAIRVTRPDGEDTTPRIFPDGRRIAFTRCSTTNPHAPGCGVWQAAAFGGDERLIAPRCNLGAIDPSGDAVICARAAPAGGVDILKVDIETRAESLVLHWSGSMDLPSISPDGRRLAFLSGGTPWLASVDGGPPIRVLEDGPIATTLAFAPDGRHLLADLSLGGRRNIWALPLEGGRRVGLTAGAGSAVYPVAARDGRSLLFTQEHREHLLFRGKDATAPPSRIDTPTYWLSFSVDTDGRFVAYADGDGADEIGVLDLATQTRSGLGRGDVAAISPDGRVLARVRDGGLVLTDLATRVDTVRVAEGVRVVKPAFTPDGGKVVFVGEHNDVLGLHVVDTVSGDIRTVQAGRFAAPSVAPDGRVVAACGDLGQPDTNGTHTFALDAEVSPVFVAGLRSYEAAPIWSNDSRSFQVLVHERSRAPRLTRVSRDGEVREPEGTALTLTPEPANWGVFDVQVTRRGEVFHLLQRVHGDVYRVVMKP